jgi:hypothetical protein
MKIKNNVFHITKHENIYIFSGFPIVQPSVGEAKYYFDLVDGERLLVWKTKCFA